MPVRTRTVAALLTAVAAGGALAAYRQTLWFGFRYDDYHAIRPWRFAELWSTFHGTWDPTGIEPRFYRPLTACWYALRFFVFGLNAVPQHAISLAGMALCAFLTGLFVWREVRRLFPAAVAAGLYAIYPAFAYAQAIWLTNQMHLFASLTVLIALIVWQRARAEGGAAWGWLLALQVIAFGFKEDTIMLLPAVALLTALRYWLLRDVRLPGWRVVALAGLIVVLLPCWRYVALGRQLGGYGRPGFARGWANLSQIVGFFLQRPAKRPWQAAAGWYCGLAFLAGLAGAALRRVAGLAYLLCCGVAIALAFNLPFYLVSKAEQYHLVALGSVLALAGALDAVRQSLPSSMRTVASLIAIPALVLLPVTRSVAQDFAPCSPITLYTDNLASGWAAVPSDIRGWLRDKPSRCRAGTLLPLTESLRAVVWANGRETDETGAPAEWTTDRAVVLLSRSRAQVDITLRTPVASSQTPTTVVIDANGRAYTLTLTDTLWHTRRLRLSPDIWSRLGRMNDLRVHVSPTFIPAERFQNGDRRVLGVLLRVPQ